MKIQQKNYTHFLFSHQKNITKTPLLPFMDKNDKLPMDTHQDHESTDKNSNNI